MSKIKTLEDLFALAGSATHLAAKLNVHQYTVERWSKIGVPMKYWEMLMNLFEITPAELFSISKHCREKRALK